MTLTEIEYGSLASSSLMNKNFQYLDGKIDDLSSLVSSNQSGTSSNISSINSSLVKMKEDINSDIEEITANLTALQSNEIFITTYINGVSWYREYFSDAAKTKRLWLEQGGSCWSISTTSFLKAFSDANYTLTLGSHSTYYDGGGISEKSAAQFSYYNSKNNEYRVDWYACGI